MHSMDLQSGYPYSLIRHGLPFQYPRLTEPLRTDVVILGGGISGALTAYHLLRAGIDCTVIDGRTIGLGSTSASTSLLQYEIDVPLRELIVKRGEHDAVRAYHLCLEALDALGRIARRIKVPEFAARKSLFFAAQKNHTTGLEQEYAVRKTHGFNVEYLGQADIQASFGFNAPGAILSHHGAHTDAYMYTHHLHQYGMRHGLRVFDRTFVEKITRHKRGVTLRTHDGIRIDARKLVYATGYEVTTFLKKKIVNLHSTYATISENMPAVERPWKKDTLLWNSADPYLYLRQTDDGRLLIGGRDEAFYNPGRRDKLIQKKSKSLQADFQRLFPDIPFRPEFSWTGTFGTTTDGLPFIGAYKPLPHSYFALGFGGNGIVFSLIAANLIRDALTGKKNPDAGIFSFDRV